jgi:toxin-antitoxin system PIN domain toxin
VKWKEINDSPISTNSRISEVLNYFCLNLVGSPNFDAQLIIDIKAWFEEAAHDSCAFCRLTQQGFLRLATNPTVFKDEAATTDVAWAFYDRVLEDERVYFMREPDGLEQAWRECMRNRGHSHRVWNDAYLAAFAQTASLEIVTFDQGFREYQAAGVTIVS